MYSQVTSLPNLQLMSDNHLKIGAAMLIIYDNL